MNQFLSFPDWAPGWLGPVLVILGALFALAFLLMPFTVFSLKSRLEQIEMKLEDLHADLHALAGPDPQSAPRSHYAWPEPPVAAAPPVGVPPPPADRYPVHPPITPAARPAPLPPEPPRRDPYRDDPRPRAEPKLNWPR